MKKFFVLLTILIVFGCSNVTENENSKQFKKSAPNQAENGNPPPPPKK
ncbi:MAG: hypothetical protein KDD94_02150 [Calditrichaeota bacterium]|nr:hypothetical protein [Calditrichota bacterium]